MEVPCIRRAIPIHVKDPTTLKEKGICGPRRASKYSPEVPETDKSKANKKRRLESTENQALYEDKITQLDKPLVAGTKCQHMFIQARLKSSFVHLFILENNKCSPPFSKSH